VNSSVLVDGRIFDIAFFGFGDSDLTPLGPPDFQPQDRLERDSLPSNRPLCLRHDRDFQVDIWDCQEQTQAQLNQ